MTSVFVIIVTYNGMRWYERCFQSLRESTIPVQVIVVDNASEDGTVEFIKERFPEVYLIASNENLGFGRANNIAMRYALKNKCDYVFLLNQDTWIEPDAIDKLIQIHLANPQYGILSPMHIKANGKALYIQIEDGKTDHGNKLLSDCYFNQLDDVYTFTYVNAAAWLLPRNTLETVGGFDPIFLHYEEDDDYLNRLAFHGLKLGLCPKIRIIHDHHESPNPLSSGKRRLFLLFVNFINPSNNDSVDRYLIRLLGRFFFCFLSGRLSKAKQAILDFRVIIRYRNRIKNSRLNNSKRQSTWL